MKTKPQDKSIEELFSDLQEPSRSIAIRAWNHRKKCLQIERDYGEEEARKYHNLHRFDGTYRTQEEKDRHN